MSAMLANQAMNYLASGSRPRRMGNAHPNIAPYQTLPGRGRLLIVAVGNDGQFARLCGVLGLEPLATRRTLLRPTPAGSPTASRSSANSRRRRASGSATTFSPRSKRAVVPAGPINTVADLFADPQFKARGMRIEPQGTPGVRSPIVMSESPLALDRRSPKLGEHTAEILREIGLE